MIDGTQSTHILVADRLVAASTDKREHHGRWLTSGLDRRVQTGWQSCRSTSHVRIDLFSIYLSVRTTVTLLKSSTRLSPRLLNSMESNFGSSDDTDMDHKSKKRPATSQPARNYSKKRHLNAEKPKKMAVPITATAITAAYDAESSDEEAHISNVDSQDDTQEAINLTSKPGNGAGSLFPLELSGASSLKHCILQGMNLTRPKKKCSLSEKHPSQMQP